MYVHMHTEGLSNRVRSIPQASQNSYSNPFVPSLVITLVLFSLPHSLSSPHAFICFLRATFKGLGFTDILLSPSFLDIH